MSASVNPKLRAESMKSNAKRTSSLNVASAAIMVMALSGVLSKVIIFDRPVFTSVSANELVSEMQVLRTCHRIANVTSVR